MFFLSKNNLNLDSFESESKKDYSVVIKNSKLYFVYKDKITQVFTTQDIETLKDYFFLKENKTDLVNKPTITDKLTTEEEKKLKKTN